MQPKFKLNETVIVQQGPKGMRMGKIINAYFPADSTEWKYGLLIQVFVMNKEAGRYDKIDSYYTFSESEMEKIK